VKRDYHFSILGLVLGIGIAALISLVLGEDPFLVLQVLVRGSLASPTSLAYSLFYATPLIFTGLAVSWAFQAGLFNIGGEGQMAIGGLAAISFGLTFPNLPFPIGIIGAILSASIAGGAWGALAGWLKAYRKVHEVLATIMLNFIAFGLVSYAVSETWKNRESQAPETSPLNEAYRIPALVDPLNASFLFGILLAAVAGILLSRTKFGFHQRMTGGSPQVGRLAGMNIERQVVIAMFVSGALAGLAGMSDILGLSLKLREGFTGGAGFIGIAVALLGRGHPIGVVLSALLFGALHKGSLDLDLDTEHISRDLAVVIQAFIIVFVASSKGFSDMAAKFRSRRKQNV
jgi:general nucleoside transport system permease protein